MDKTNGKSSHLGIEIDALQVDEHGRILITDDALLEEIAGAATDTRGGEDPMANTGCLNRILCPENMLCR